MNTQDIFEPRKRSFKWLGILFACFILAIILELVIIANHYPYQGLVLLMISWMLLALLIGGVKCLAYKIDPGPTVYISDHDIAIGKKRVSWKQIHDVELDKTEKGGEILFFWLKPFSQRTSEADLFEALCQVDFDPLKWTQLKQCVEKYQQIVKIKD